MTSSRFARLACCVAFTSIVALWPAEAAAQAKTAGAMVQAANAFLASLTPERQAKASMSFDDGERQVWQESPGVRSGVVLRDLNPAQNKLAMALLRTGVGDGGYQRIRMSMERETVLSALQKTPEVLDLLPHGLGTVNTLAWAPPEAAGSSAVHPANPQFLDLVTGGRTAQD